MIMIEGAKAGRLGVVRMMLDHVIDVNFRDEARHTALQWSAFRGHLRVARLLLEYGADAKISDLSGWRVTNPLLLASLDGHVGVMKLLLQSDASVDTRPGTGAYY
jgi:ankyrin repeat protein